MFPSPPFPSPHARPGTQSTATTTSEEQHKILSTRSTQEFAGLFKDASSSSSSLVVKATIRNRVGDITVRGCGASSPFCRVLRLFAASYRHSHDGAVELTPLQRLSLLARKTFASHSVRSAGEREPPSEGNILRFRRFSSRRIRIT